MSIATWGQNSYGQSLLNKARSGDAKAQYELSQSYKYGWNGLEKNTTECLKWLRSSAQNSYAEAQYDYGNLFMYNQGRDYGISNNDAEYIKWMRKAATGNYNPAIYSIGLYNEFTVQNINEALLWYKKAAARDYGPAMYSLGLYYENTVQNMNEAVSWYKKAMDTSYKKLGQKDESADSRLRKLGIVYDPVNGRQTGNLTMNQSTTTQPTSKPSSNNENRCHDALAFGLKGPVKKCTVIGDVNDPYDFYELTFTENGKLASVTYKKEYKEHTISFDATYTSKDMSHIARDSEYLNGFTAAVDCYDIKIYDHSITHEQYIYQYEMKALFRSQKYDLDNPDKCSVKTYKYVEMVGDKRRLFVESGTVLKKNLKHELKEEDYEEEIGFLGMRTSSCEYDYYLVGNYDKYRNYTSFIKQYYSSKKNEYVDVETCKRTITYWE
jgi:hypothetical protein